MPLSCYASRPVAAATVTLSAVFAPSLKNCAATSGRMPYIIMLKKPPSSPPSQNTGCCVDTGDPGMISPLHVSENSSAISRAAGEAASAPASGRSTHWLPLEQKSLAQA